jgi:hypothetical protein
MKGIPIFFKSPPFLVSKATAAKFVQPIQIVLAYLVPLDVIILLLSFFLPPKVYLTYFSATTEWKSMKLHRNVKNYE